MKYQLVGQVAGTEGATVRASLTYLSDYRDPDGQVPPPVLLFERLPGQEWTAQPGSGPAWVWGPNSGADDVPRVQVAYTVAHPGMPPFSRVVLRRVLPNTTLPGYWDWTRPDTHQPAFSGGGALPTPVEVMPGQGPPGERGPGWLFGEGPPTPGRGRGGDAYLDMLSWDVYVRDAVGWSLRGNLKGAAGGVGAQGPRGMDGRGFPVPTEAQLGHLAIADGSQPAGFSWRPTTDLRLRLGDLLDVDLNTLRDGQTLVWNAAARRWRPGAASAGPGEGPVTPSMPTLENGVPVMTTVLAASGPEDPTTIYQLDLPPGVAELRVTAAGSAELMVALVRDLSLEGPPEAFAEPGHDPTTARLSNPAAGRWYVVCVATGGQPVPGVTITASWGDGSGSPGESFIVQTDPEGYQTIEGAEVETDAEGYQTIQGAAATADADGYETVERS